MQAELIAQALNRNPKLMIWSPGEPLPRAQNAEIDPRKFEAYSMNPANPANQGKWVAFEAIGYDVQNILSRRLAAQKVISQLKQQLTNAPAIQGQTSTYGLRFEVEVMLEGTNGRQGCLITVWQIDHGSENPRLITNWLEVYR